MDIQANLAVRFDNLQKSFDAQRVALTELTAELERYRGEKWMRLPTILQGKATGGVLNLGPDNPASTEGQVLGPEPGWAWSLRRLVVDGLTSGATPDVVNLYRGSSTGQPPLWQFNGNNFGYTFGRLEMVLHSGDTLALVSVGSFAAIGTIRLSGEMISLPAPMLAKLS